MARRKAVDVGDPKEVAEANENGKRKHKGERPEARASAHRLGKSADGWAKIHKSREEGKVDRSCLGFDEARRRAFICKADSRQYETIILRAKMS